MLTAATLSVSCPIASLLAEVIISRYKLVSFSLKAMWLLAIAGTIMTVCEGSLHVEKSKLQVTQLLLFAIPQNLLMGVFIATAVPLALDQINGGSNANISAFIQWLSWAYYSGLSIPPFLESVINNCIGVKGDNVSMIMSLLSVLMLSVGLILDFCFHHKLVKEPVTVNPVGLIFKVLKYAAKHKYPVQRSAFTYCENEQPTRLDYGKSKYGGPFTTEQVEDAKTFWRILAVILVTALLFAPLIANWRTTMKNASSSQTSCITEVTHTTIRPYTSVMLSIPLYELLIYPCLTNRSPSILKSIGIGAAAVIASSLYGIIVEASRHVFTNISAECILMQDHNLNIMEVSIEIPFNILLGLTDVLLRKCYLEFICAQAPYNMNGILTGIFFSLYTSCIAVGILLLEAWRNIILDTSTCGIWFYLTTLVLAVVTSALVGLVIRWYKARERDDLSRSQNLVEEVYHKYQERNPNNEF